ncbi:hypothetical protein RSK20926_03594 [Roseobacter sp. SK209-2-6]|uniref:DUF3726 domain-containing protein n=1 Tax=Roseobacter sp. SK209-2-6 TaxID=388739 RepID=UPI0000F3ED19|nr:DUF3726 domain-containing protein [Roseobacter sp. SK209-2-6]EBA16857.1 hypothetical protein RSK20926_03594 [Roseobacter sp. SK209-2-6]
MNHSLNEIEAMSKRAARGAGLSWGLAEEAAKGTRWLAAFSFPGAEMLADLLTLNDRLPALDFSPAVLSGTWAAPAGRMSPLIAGAAMSDCAVRMEAGQVIEMENVSLPLLVVPFAAGAALRLGVPVSVTWEDARLTTDGQRLCVQGEREAILCSHASTLTCAAPAEMSGQSEPVMRADVDPQAWEKLGEFAHRTYAPATEASRILGAGAGLSDND